MTTAAIEHGTLSAAKYHGCKCLACADAAAAYQSRRHRQIGYGTWQPLVAAGPARAHIEALHEQGMTWEQIAGQAGLRVEDLTRIRLPLGGRPRTERLRPDRAEVLLGVRFVPLAPAPKSCVPALGTIRRLQALRANGWPVNALADRIGMHHKAVSFILRQAFVQAATHDRVVVLFEDLRDQDPRRYGVTPVVAERTIRAAAARRWAPPHAWQGDMDDLATKPGPRSGRRYAAPSPGDRQLAVIENTAELARAGCTGAQIAERLGITWDAVQLAHRRAGVDMPRLAA
jgi:transcriptional regulator with XRE-family HTH domain